MDTRRMLAPAPTAPTDEDAQRLDAEADADAFEHGIRLDVGGWCDDPALPVYRGTAAPYRSAAPSLGTEPYRTTPTAAELHAKHAAWAKTAWKNKGDGVVSR